MNIDIVYIVIVIAAILVSMTFHEAMHAFTSYWLGDDTARLLGRLTLNPIKHIDPFMTLLLPVMLALVGAPIFGGAKPVPFNPNNIRYGEWGAALVALAGPITNLVIAFIMYGVWVVVGQPDPGQSILGLTLVTTVSVNLGFFVFNMIPIPPLDGSRVLYALAPEFVRRGMEAIERYGIMFVFVVIFIAGPSLSIFLVSVINFFLELFAKILIH